VGPLRAASPGFDGTASLPTTGPGAVHPDRIRSLPRNDGLARVEGVRFEAPGTHDVTAEHDGVRAVGNPVVVREDPDYRVPVG